MDLINIHCVFIAFLYIVQCLDINNIWHIFGEGKNVRYIKLYPFVGVFANNKLIDALNIISLNNAAFKQKFCLK